MKTIQEILKNAGYRRIQTYNYPIKDVSVGYVNGTRKHGSAHFYATAIQEPPKRPVWLVSIHAGSGAASGHATRSGRTLQEATRKALAALATTVDNNEEKARRTAAELRSLISTLQNPQGEACPENSQDSAAKSAT